MKKSFVALLVVLLAISSFCFAAGASEDDGVLVIKGIYMNQAGYQMEDIEQMAADYEAAHPGIDVQIEYVAYDALHDKIVTAGASGAGTYDFVLLDCIWPAEFSEAGFLLDLTDYISEEEKADYWSGALQAMEYKGRIWGLPQLMDNHWFFYNTEMLAEAGFDHPPRTWSELREMALVAKEKGICEYPFIGGYSQSETLVCNFSFMLSAFGGSFFDEDNMPTFNSPEGVAALTYMVNGLNEGWINPASLESYDEDIRRIFSSGEAMFSVNWIYQLALANDPAESNIAGNAALAMVPGEVMESACLNGGMGLGIMASSKHPDETYDFIKYISSPEVEVEYAQRAFPVWKSVFDDPRVKEAQPDAYELSVDQFNYIVNRPIVPFYTETSRILARETQAALLGMKTPQQALDDAAAEIIEVRAEFME